MQEKIQILMDLLEINKAQATDIIGRYLKSVKDIHAFLDFYFETLERENIVGTTYEKLRRVCKRAEIEFKKRFEDKEIFLEWLCDKYKNKSCFRVFKGDFEYYYYAKYGSNKLIIINQKSADMLIKVNQFKELAYANGERIEEEEFKAALIDYMFKNQEKIGKITPLLKPIKAQKVLSLEEIRVLKNKEETRLYNANKDKFLEILQSRMNKNIS
ncbi:TPA: hypothetical protein RTH14_001677 [Campylobacter jejuni]|nr:hypothetical protein [Campylobacter jejuni]HDZ5099456.1 hypothetical protein [Campylobacter jejuni]HDZ5102817.1 hypothetical protein [Campylobacter jejuni]HDZ5104484.1 hypothetical protein [Campylobacter jejuni]HDZ5109009.1 hypothetical protein [Campylobacter jejuni]